MHKGPVTVIATEYGTRLDKQPVSRSATVDDVPDFVNLYEYDAEGNRTRRSEVATGEVTEYTWDHRNRLVRVTTRTTDNGPLTTDTQYAYDYLNRWIGRSHDLDGDGPLGFTDTYFVYDGTPSSGSPLDRAAVTMENIGQIVLHFEADGQGDPQLAHRYLRGPAVDQILADEQVTDPTAPGNIVWPLTDHLNTVRDLASYDADSDTTTIVNHLLYDAYGRITSQSDPDQTTLFAFTARPFDQATGLENNLNRWFDAEVGRWISEDPIGFDAADGNLYRYVENMVTTATDSTGLEKALSISFMADWKIRWAAAWNDFWAAGLFPFTIRIDSQDPNWTGQTRRLQNMFSDGKETVIIAGHGGTDWIGLFTIVNLNDPTSPEYRFLEALGKKLADNATIELRACGTCAGSTLLIQRIAEITGAKVIGYDDVYAVVPHGTQYTAHPDGSVEETGRFPSYSDSFWNKRGGWEIKLPKPSVQPGKPKWTRD